MIRLIRVLILDISMYTEIKQTFLTQGRSNASINRPRSTTDYHHNSQTLGLADISITDTKVL